MNLNKNNNDNNPWGSGGNSNNPWGGGGSNNNMDFEDSIKKARDKFGKFKIGGPRNISLLILIGLYNSIIDLQYFKSSSKDTFSLKYKSPQSIINS